MIYITFSQVPHDDRVEFSSACGVEHSIPQEMIALLADVWCRSFHPTRYD